LGCMPRSGTAGSYDSSIFSFVIITHTDFHSSYTNLYSHQHCMRVPFSPTALTAFLVVLMIALLTAVRSNLSAVLVYISFMTKDVEHFFMNLLTIHTSSFDNCHMPSNWIIWGGVVFNFLSLLCILDINPFFNE
jgi:hypothetical protein